MAIENLRYSFLFLILLTLTTCLDKIDFERPESFVDAISIQGKLIKGDPSTVEVKVQEIFDLRTVNQFVSVKEIFLMDELGNEIPLKPKQTGIYGEEIPIDHPSFKVDYGKQYKINLTTVDGVSYESAYDEIFPAVKPDSLTVKQIIKNVPNRNEDLVPRPFIGFYLYTPTKPKSSTQNARLHWEIIFTYKLTDTPQLFTPSACCFVPMDREPKSCYITDYPVSNHLVFDASNLLIDRLDDVEMLVETPYHLFAEGYYLTVHQQSLSEAAMEYWKQINLIFERTGDVFQDPVGKITTNFKRADGAKQEVYGFFYATEQSTIRVYADPELAGSPDNYCPPPGGPGCVPVVCCNCALIENSTPIKPDWWIE